METAVLLLAFIYLNKTKEIRYIPELEEQTSLVRQRFHIPDKYIVKLTRDRGSRFSEFDEDSWKYMPNLIGGEPHFVNVVADRSHIIEIIDIKDESDDESNPLPTPDVEIPAFLRQPTPLLYRSQSDHPLGSSPQPRPQVREDLENAYTGQPIPRRDYRRPENLQDQATRLDKPPMGPVNDPATEFTRKQRGKKTNVTADRPRGTQIREGYELSANGIRFFAGPRARHRCSSCRIRGQRCHEQAGDGKSCAECREKKTRCSFVN